MNRVIGLLTLLTLASIAATGAATTRTYHESSTPKVLSQWVKSADGKLAVCISTGRTTYSIGEAVSVTCAIRNMTGKAITVLSPFGDPFYAYSSGLTILGPDGPVQYRGPMKEYMLSTSAFVELAPHSVAEETIDLPAEVLSDLGKSGLYIIRYVFQSGGHPKQPPPDNFWQGQIETAPQTILFR